MKIYIAGPMRGYPEFNFPAFFAAEDDLENVTPLGSLLTIANPARHDEDCGIDTTGMNGDEDLWEQGFRLKDALSWDLAQVMTSDYLVLLKGWEKSTGALLEVRTAMALDIPCYPRADAVNPEDCDFDIHVNEGESIPQILANAQRRGWGVNGEVRITSATGGQVEWRAIPSALDYEVSQDGGVRRSTSGMGTRRGRVRKQSLNGNGYLVVSLRVNGVTVNRKVHQLVAEAFIGDRGGLDTCHNNGIRTDNRASNLRYDTRSGNLADREAHGRPHRGENVGSALLTEVQVGQILRFKRRETRDLAAEYGVAPRTIRDIWNRKTWRHVA